MAPLEAQARQVQRASKTVKDGLRSLYQVIQSPSKISVSMTHEPSHEDAPPPLPPIDINVEPPLLPVPGDVSLQGDKLCEVCEKFGLKRDQFVVRPGEDGFDESDDNESDEGRPELNLGSIKDIMERTSCPLCRLALVAVSSAKDVLTEEEGEPICISLEWDTTGAADPDTPWDTKPEVRLLRAYVRTQSGRTVGRGSWNLFPEITLLANDSPTDSTAYFVRPIHRDHVDIGLIRRWLAICDANHADLCRENAVLKELQRTHPAGTLDSFRCIDVERGCLVVPPEGAQYAALSYVWGRRKFFTTLKENVAKLEQPHALESEEFWHQIPLTIKDSILLTKRLGIKYLWVDSLCIVQDEEFAHKIQAIKMMDVVYSAAHLVIVAASSSDAYSGIPGIHPGSRISRQPVEEIEPGFRLAFKPRWQDDLSRSAYNGRGWTFQETHFATKSLYFVGGRAVYRCQHSDGWEEHLFENPNEVNGTDNNGMTMDGDDIGDFEGLIQGYSERTLSYESDIYNAFAGVSRQLVLRLNTNLCHGIFARFFDWCLLWGPLHEQTRRSVAPSWSWSGWHNQSFPRIWDWYTRRVDKISNAIGTRTWIIWYQRESAESTACRRVMRFHEDADNQRAAPTPGTNFYGRKITSRFAMDCSRTEPTALSLTHLNLPRYAEDVISGDPGSGYLQFWTVSLTLRIGPPTSEDTEQGPPHNRRRLGLFGLSDRELGTVSVQPDWAERNPAPQEREFILLCEGRDERAEGHQEDEEPGWRYKLMLLEWIDNDGVRGPTGEIQGPYPKYAERVAIGSIDKGDLGEALGGGPVWKEIVLG